MKLSSLNRRSVTSSSRSIKIAALSKSDMRRVVGGTNPYAPGLARAAEVSANPAYLENGYASYAPGLARKSVEEAVTDLNAYAMVASMA